MKYFGTDGVRGVFGEELTDELAFKIGVALGKLMGGGRVLIGKDTRVSGDPIACAVAAGLLSSGVDVMDCGILPTPAIALLTRIIKAYGVVISASHNPPEYNGIKILRNGYKIPDEMEEKIEELLDGVIERKKIVPGKVRSFPEGKHLYMGAVLEMFKDLDLSDVTLVLDLAEGATIATAREILEYLGAKVKVFNGEGRGEVINQGCGATHPEFLAQRVLPGEIGVSFDGDGDRSILLDERGRVVDGDKIIGILAQGLLGENRLPNRVVVGTVMTNSGLEKFLNGMGVKLLRTKVGDKYVLEGMQGVGSNLGGEKSGHVIILDRSTTGDGLITTLEVLRTMRRVGKSLAELSNQIPEYPQVTRNVRRTENMRVERVHPLIDKYEREGFRVVVRPSGTEPVIRITVEGEREERFEEIISEIVRALEG